MIAGLSMRATEYISLGSVAVFLLGLLLSIVISAVRNKKRRLRARRETIEALEYIDRARGLNLEKTTEVDPSRYRL